MRKDILEAIKRREEAVPFAGGHLIVEELSSAADLSAEKDDPDLFYKLMVACVFEAVPVEGEEGKFTAGAPALSAEDIPNLRAGSRKALSPLVLAVQRVNGMIPEDEAKKS